jgi:hypothetical protein
MILTTPEPFITTAQLKDKLNKSSATADDEFTLYVEASCEMIRDRMGEVASVDAVETFYPKERRDVPIILSHTPVIEITRVVDRYTGLDIPTYADPVNGWYLESVEGIVRHSLYWPAQGVNFEYRAGREPIPANFTMAALDLAAHLWKGSQQNSQAGRPQVGQDGVIVPGSSWALPYSVRQTLGLDKRPRRDVWVG